MESRVLITFPLKKLDILNFYHFIICIIGFSSHLYPFIHLAFSNLLSLYITSIFSQFFKLKHLKNIYNLHCSHKNLYKVPCPCMVNDTLIHYVTENELSKNKSDYDGLSFKTFSNCVVFILYKKHDFNVRYYK